MEQFLNFLQNFWWIVFPLFGLGTAAFHTISSARERTAKLEHKQKMELLAAQGQSQQIASAPTASTRDQLIELMGTHDEVTARWLDYELDVTKLIEFPAMSDGRQPLTAAFLRAKRGADTLRPLRADAEIDAERLTAYRTAVAEFGAAFDIAESDARRVKAAGFTPDEQARLSRAKTMLTTALDEAATPAERQLAYKRVRAEIDGLIAISPESLSILESKVGREITSGQAEKPQEAGGEPDVLPPHRA